METVNEILDFNFSAINLQQAARSAISAGIRRLHEVRINKLIKIREDVGEAEYKEPPHATIQQVFKKFKSIIEKDRHLLENFDKRELKTLAYSLSHSEYNSSQIFSKPNELDFVFQALETSWKDSFLIGLIDCYLRNWETNHTSSAEKLGNFIFKKLRNYDGNRTVLKSLKSNMKFFDGKNGDSYLGSELAKQNKQIKEATKFLSLPENRFVYPYFSKVILAYYVVRKNDVQQFIDDLNNALNEHKNSVTDRRLISQLIIQANKPEFIQIKEKVKRIALERLLDPQRKDSIWHPFEGATENETTDIRTAKKIVLQWIAEQFINVFFEKCINDTRRKRFWLKYAKEITDFRVVGSTAIRRILMNDERISEIVSPRFSKTNSTNDRNSALMFIMKTHLFIEFSDEGAFYAYSLSNSRAPSIEEPYYFSTSNLKTPSMPWLAYPSGRSIYSMNDEGRLGHNDGDLAWEDVAIHWLKNKVGINV